MEIRNLPETDADVSALTHTDRNMDTPPKAQ